MSQTETAARYVLVRRDSSVGSVGRHVAFCLQRAGDRLDVRAVGAAAVNQAVKAIAVATRMVRDDRGLTLRTIILLENGPARDEGTISRITMKVEAS